MIGRAPTCIDCRHFGEPKKDEFAMGFWCRAFLEGIPTPIIMGVVNHAEPYMGDGGIRFEKRSD